MGRGFNRDIPKPKRSFRCQFSRYLRVVRSAKPEGLPHKSVGTSLKVIISRDQRTFVAKADVIHVQEQIGMGIAFVDPPQDQLKILDSWLAALPSTTSVGSTSQSKR